MKIAFLGDIALFETGMLKLDWAECLKEIEQYLSTFDMVIANLEVPITDQKKTFTCKGMHLRTEKEIIDVLKFLHIHVVCLANNHIFDFGYKGMDETIEILNKNEIAYYGVNNRSFEYVKNGQRLRFHGYCCYSSNGAGYINKKTNKGVNPLTKKNLIKALEQDDKDNYLSVLSLHWGDEYSQLPNEAQVTLIHQLVENHSFILHGHHAHVMQGIEKIGNSVLAYNQGNFCFDECQSPVNPKLVIKQSNLNRESFILSVEIENSEIVKWNTTGIFYDGCKVKLIDNSEKLRYLSEKIKYCRKEEYKAEAEEMIKKQKSENLAKHDIKWLFSKLNYYSIGAKIASYKNKKLYKKEFY